MWTPFPLTTQLVGWVNLLEKCEGAYVIMMIRSSPHALPAALMVVGDGHREGGEPLKPLSMGRFAIHLQSNAPNMP